MGMSASQARFLCLTARKNNVEFEGQQINQQRTTLSNESASYYSELCNMEVPVPPSIDDYTKVTYSFNDGAMTNTVTSLLFSSSEGKYHLNYLQQWQDDYSVVPASSALVQKTESGYNVGGTELRKMDASAPETLPASVANDPYYQSLPDDAARLDALKTEEYYVALLREELNDSNAEFYVRYVKNATTGAYQPYFYLESQLQDESLYNDRNLAAISCYSIGSSVKTKEVLNQTLAAVEQDASGRYISFTYDSTTTTVMIPENNQAEINEWLSNNPEPQITDEEFQIFKDNQVDIDNYITTHEYPQKEDFIRKSPADSHYAQWFLDGTTQCRGNAMSGDSGCYMHLLAALLHPERGESDPSLIYYETTTGESLPVPKNYGYTTTPHEETNLIEVSKAIVNGCVVEGHDAVLITSEITDTSTETGKLLSDYYLKTGSATDIQKMFSNYFINSEGEIENKSLKQKCVDIYYLISHHAEPEFNLDYDTQLKPLISTFTDDMTTLYYYAKDEYEQALEDWEENTTYKWWYEEDTTGYTEAHDKWLADKPKLNEWETPENVTTPGKKYYLNTSTVTDEEAYNDAMNDYYYRQHEYDHKVQEINAKLEIIQQQDKQLELKLKQLDTEENAISTEMDAVKKVISKNVDNSFKTFSA